MSEINKSFLLPTIKDEEIIMLLLVSLLSPPLFILKLIFVLHYNINDAETMQNCISTSWTISWTE